MKNEHTERLYTQFGGRLENQGFVPTGETLCFLVGWQHIDTFANDATADHFCK